jgi:DNA-binding transcriptional LysR family regulator
VRRRLTVIKTPNEPSFTLRHMAVLVAVGEAGSITKAAQRLHLTASAVSTAITELERRLGATLTVRQRAKGVELTPTGEEVVLRARDLLRDATALQDEMRGSGAITGPVRVGCYQSLGPTVLPPLISDFTTAHPRATVEFHEASQDDLRHLIDRGLLDLAVTYDLDRPPDWQMLPLLRRTPAVVLPGNHRLAQEPEGIRLRDLAEEPMVLLDAPPSSYHAHLLCTQAGFSPTIAYRTTMYETARAFVGFGLGWTLLVQRPYADTTYRGQALAVKPIIAPSVQPVTIGLAWASARPMSRPARAFVEMARITFGPNPMDDQESTS